MLLYYNYILEDLINYKTSLSAISINFSTQEECMISVRAGGAKEFINVPQSLQTNEMCIRAVLDNKSMINYIRSDLITDEIKSICGL